MGRIVGLEMVAWSKTPRRYRNSPWVDSKNKSLFFLFKSLLAIHSETFILLSFGDSLQPNWFSMFRKNVSTFSVGLHSIPLRFNVFISCLPYPRRVWKRNIIHSLPISVSFLTFIIYIYKDMNDVQQINGLNSNRINISFHMLKSQSWNF